MYVYINIDLHRQYGILVIAQGEDLLSCITLNSWL